MQLYIKIKDGQPFGHPMIGENVRQAFPGVDLSNTTEFAPFLRVQMPNIGEYEVYEGCNYELLNGYYVDVHHVRPMTESERAEVDAKKLEALKANSPGPNWVWNEAQQKWTFPPRPTSGGPWRFDLQTKDWVLAPQPPFPDWVIGPSGLVWVPPIPRPQDGQNYRWDQPTSTWILVNG
jgi:hypothetical protein